MHPIGLDKRRAAAPAHRHHPVEQVAEAAALAQARERAEGRPRGSSNTKGVVIRRRRCEGDRGDVRVGVRRCDNDGKGVCWT